MRSTLIVTVFACLAMASFQWSTERRLALTKKFEESRRLGIKFPPQMCKPLHKAGVMILDAAVMCAVEAIIPNATTIVNKIKQGAKIASKFGINVMGKINELKKKESRVNRN